MRVPLASLAALLLVAIGASVTRQLTGGAVSIALAVPVIVWLGLETPVVEGAIGAVIVGVLLDAAAGGPGGLLAGLPALCGNGLLSGLDRHLSLPKGYYSALHILIVLGFMALARIRRPEGLRHISPGELGKVVGLTGCRRCGPCARRSRC